MSGRDCYQILGIDRNAPPDAVRAAYVRLAKRHHPDLATGGNALPNRLSEIQRAYHELSDPARRSAHDRLLASQEEAHNRRQRRVFRRLRHYDWRHPRPAPRRYRRVGWRSLLVVGVGIAVVARLSLALAG